MDSGTIAGYKTLESGHVCLGNFGLDVTLGPGEYAIISATVYLYIPDGWGKPCVHIRCTITDDKGGDIVAVLSYNDGNLKYVCGRVSIYMLGSLDILRIVNRDAAIDMIEGILDTEMPKLATSIGL